MGGGGGMLTWASLDATALSNQLTFNLAGTTRSYHALMFETFCHLRHIEFSSHSPDMQWKKAMEQKATLGSERMEH